MITALYNTNVCKVANMLDITDDFIRSISNGEVLSKGYPFKMNEKHSTVDEEIFGELLLGDEAFNMRDNFRMGHIELPIPIVNIQYFLGRKPLLHKILQMDIKDIDKIIYQANYVVVESTVDDLKYKQLLTDKELNEALEKYEGKFKFSIGGEAIKLLLLKDGLTDTDGNLYSNYFILNTIPVLPLVLRFDLRVKDGKPTYVDSEFEVLYNRILNRTARLRRLLELGAPTIIVRNESRMLQEAVDDLISNGLRKTPISYNEGIPYDSLNELYEDIVGFKVKQEVKSSVHLDEKSLVKAVNNIQMFWDSIPDGIEWGHDDPRELEIETLEAELHNILTEYVAEVVSECFSDYLDYRDDISTNVTTDLSSGLRDCVNNEDFIEMVEFAMIKRIQLYIKKNIKWN